jgi:hypothetical protein
MRPIVFLTILALTGCAATTLPVMQPIPNPVYYPKRAAKPVERIEKIEKVEKVQAVKTETPRVPEMHEHDFTPTEDRFISTHAPDISVQYLGLTPEQVLIRSEQMSKH